MISAAPTGTASPSPRAPQDTIASQATDTISRVISDTLLTDSIPSKADTLPHSDSLRPKTLPTSIDTTASTSDTARRKAKTPLEGPVYAQQEDSLVYDVRTKELTMYKRGQVKYTEMQIDAAMIRLNLDSNNVEARGEFDTITQKYERPTFKEGEANYELDSVRYNLHTQKALSWGIRTQEGEGIITSGLIKKMPDNVIHMKGGQYTTCDAECPHFYLQMTKGTVEPHKKVVFGPAYMVIEDVPFYILGLPFGFFPQQGARNSGFIIPQVGEEVVKGFFLRDGGYYFVFNDYLDLKLTAGIYTLGSWEASAASGYRKRYQYNGNVRFDFAKDIFGEKGSADRVDQQNIRLQWTHQQDPKFRPNSTFSASVNYSTSKYNKYNATNINDYLASQVSSSVAYSKNWTGTPFSLAMNASHSQNMQDSSMSLTLPSLVFNVTRVNPFKRKNAVGKEKWYEKIAFTFQTNFSNSAQFKEKDFFKKEMFDKMKYGFQHTLPVSASFNLLKYLNITPGASYTERWYFRKIYQDWNPETERVEATDTTNGFYRVYNYNVSLGFNTRLYGMYTLGRKQRIKIRHVMNPTASLSYAPNFGDEKYGYYKTIQSDKYGGTTTYSPFANEIYGVPGNGQNMSLNFGIGNTLEMKVPSSRDTTGERKIKVLEALNITSSYNFLADSLQLAPFSVTLRTTLFKGVSLNVNATFDPYQADPVTGRRINRFVIRDGKGLARLTSLNFGFSYGFSSPARKKSTAGMAASNNPENNGRNQIENALNDPTQNAFFNQTENQYANAMKRAQMLATQYYDFNIPWSVSFNYNFSWSRPGNKITRVQTVGFNGSVNLTEKWAVEFGAGYDFILNKLTPGTVMIRRDMHCLQATFSWVPIGFRQSWTFSIRAKSSMLADVIKYKKTNSFIDNYYGY